MNHGHAANVLPYLQEETGLHCCANRSAASTLQHDPRPLRQFCSHGFKQATGAALITNLQANTVHGWLFAACSDGSLPTGF